MQDENFELKKISLQDEKPMKRKFGKGKKILAFLFVILTLIVALSAYTAVKAKTVYENSQRTYVQAKLAFNSMKQQNVVRAKEELLKTGKEIDRLKESMQPLGYMKHIPLVNGYYNDAVHAINASSYAVDAGITVTDSLIPYADVLGLKGDKSFVAGSAEDRIQTAVKTLGKIVPNIDEIEVSLVKAREEIDQVDPEHYPRISKIKTVRENIEMVRTLTDESVIAIQEAKPLIKVLPELLGEPDQKKYLVIFQNDKELRPTGGFLTFYAIFRVERGVINVDSASDIYHLDDSISAHPPAPDIIRTYLPNERVLYIRNANLSPDFSESMKEFKAIYDKSRNPKVDGIIALDTHVLVNVLNILGEVEAGGVKFNSSIDPRCDCPQVVYLLESFVGTRVGHIVENRKAIIGELLYAIMKKALSSSPKEYWGPLLQQAFKDAQEKHILFHLYNEDAQKGLEALNLAGRIREFEGDYLHINDSNFGGAKSNLYVKQSVKVEYQKDKEGNITKKVTIDYKNPYPHSPGCNLEAGGLCLNGTLRDYLRVYVPEGSVLIDTQGSQVNVNEKKDLGKTVFDAFLEVRAMGKSQIMFEYRLPFKLKDSSALPVLIQKQPGTADPEYEIYVNGKKKESFKLAQDKVITLTGL
jgi:hypothetical protein